MKHNRNKYTLSIIGLLFISHTFAQYEVRKHTINSGGSKLTGGQYLMNSSIAQIDATNTLTGGNYNLNGGFWEKNSNENPNVDLIFENSFE